MGMPKTQEQKDAISKRLKEIWAAKKAGKPVPASKAGKVKLKPGPKGKAQKSEKRDNGSVAPKEPAGLNVYSLRDHVITLANIAGLQISAIAKAKVHAEIESSLEILATARRQSFGMTKAEKEEIEAAVTTGGGEDEEGIEEKVEIAAPVEEKTIVAKAFVPGNMPAFQAQPS